MKKEKLNTKMLKSTSGITLIALVVTIIVLLILAGVSINIVLGKNGIFSKAQESKTTMEKAVLIDKIETLIVNWKADNIVDNSVTVERFWKDLENADIIDDANEVGDPVATETVDGVKKDIYEIETTDGYTVEIIVTEEPDGEIHISIGDMELNTSALPKIYISLEADETSITVNATVRRLNDGKITYSYREQGTTNWTEIKKDTTDLTATITGLETGKNYEVKAYVKSSTGESQVIKIKETGIKITAITLNKTSENLKRNETLNLIATVQPENATNKELEWTSSNTEVATVDQNGLVTAVGKGTATITVTAKDGSGLKSTCSITVKQSFTYTETASNDISYAKYYADLNGDGEIDEEIDGVIFADLLKDGGKSGEWNGSEGEYTISTINSAKNYLISNEEYTGKFGTAKVLKANGVEEDRFYVMALKDVTYQSENEEFSWYDSAGNSGISDFSIVTFQEFGKGKINTGTMIEKWNNKKYGKQNNLSKGCLDIWSVIQEKYENGWFVPSIQELCAFGDQFNINNVNRYGMESLYASSSLANELYSWNFDIMHEKVNCEWNLSCGFYFRLCKIF